MKKTKIAYWIFTSLFAFMMLSSAIPDILSSQVAVQGMHDGLGYPVYFIPFIGTAKLLGVIAILVPSFSRLKEWAYAGLVFDLLGATYSVACTPAPIANVLFMAVPLTLAAGSYIFYHKKLRAKLAANSQLYHQSKFTQTEEIDIAKAAVA